ncbi:MAG: tetratricopeptide repeat protein [Bacteroidota bacterium]|nr:tetratricopeptide repeat protein [Bacteroidota bacterium]
MKAERRTASTGPIPTRQISSEKKALRKPSFLISALFLLVTVIFAYSNHFENPFEFDDDHTIVNNTGIRKLSNIPYFFTDSVKSSTLPANQAWRPGLVTLNAVDYAIQHRMDSLAREDSTGFAAKIERTFSPQWNDAAKNGRANGINPFWFHFSIFCSYLLLGFLLFFFLLHILRKAFPEINYTHWAALIGTGLFMLHTANAETINYIISRDDSFSTMMVVLAFVIYFYSPLSRKYFLFFIPVFLGYFVKEPTVMFAPLLLVYIWLFGDPDKKKGRMIVQLIFGFTLAIIMYFVSRGMTTEHHTYGGGEWYKYILTQLFVVVHYFNSFFLPFNLSADTDWKLVQTVFDDRVIAGLFIIVFLLIVTWKCSRKQETKPIAFGLLWFFIALLPTSLFPLSEVLNDHRPFFAYIGLTLSLAATGIYLLRKINDNKNIKLIKYGMTGFSILLLSAHIAGTRHRNYVWSSGETLWKDVTEKSPGNGRGWMNYGLTFMRRNTSDSIIRKNSMDSAILCFTRSLNINPDYSYININMAITLSRTGKDAAAEPYYTKAITVDPYNPECYYFYGLYLIKMNRGDQAIKILNQGLAISPAHEGINLALNSLGGANFISVLQSAQDAVKKNPTPENYVNLSLAFYNNGQYPESAAAAKAAASLKPDYGIAWNNVCAAYNNMGEWDSALVAGTRAVELNPQDEKSRNNYIFAQQQKLRFEKLEAEAKVKNDFASWVNLGLEWDKAGNYRKFMIAEQQATLLKPNDPLGWNNVCVAANKLHDWDRAIVAGERAVKLNPDYQLAKNNLAEARKGKGNSQ